jgi:superoxide dismutase
MKTFNRPDSAWLPQIAFDTLVAEYRAHWAVVDTQQSNKDIVAFATAQNQAMLLKFFLEQAFGAGRPPSGKLLQILQRDFGGVELFLRSWTQQSLREDVEWIVLGLSFADFKFHLFPFGFGGAPIPFCISPMMCTCLRNDVILRANMTRKVFAEQQRTHIDWEVVEMRIECLETPLNVFEEGKDCVEKACVVESPAKQTI